MKRLILIIMALVGNFGLLQSQSDTVSFDQILRIVKNYHPLITAASLQIDKANANTQISRGNFDPNFSFQNNQKSQNGIDYYQTNRTGFEAATLSPIKVSAGYENNGGTFLNPENKTPNAGLYYAGVDISVLKNAITDKRRTQLKQAKLWAEQSNYNYQDQMNMLFTEIITDFLHWQQSYLELVVYEQSIQLVEERLMAIRQETQLGSRADIDTLETYLLLQNFLNSKNQARLEVFKSRLALSAHLWQNADMPLDITESAIPSTAGWEKIEQLISQYGDSIYYKQLPENHPQLLGLGLSVETTELDLKLKKQALLPDLRLKYQFLSTSAFPLSEYNTQNNRLGLTFGTPLFLRTERGEYKKARIEYESALIKQNFKVREIQLKNKSYWEQVLTYKQNHQVFRGITEGYRLLYDAEIERNEAGASDLFVVNTRQMRLTDAELKLIDLYNKMQTSKIFYLENAGVLYLLQTQ